MQIKDDEILLNVIKNYKKVSAQYLKYKELVHYLAFGTFNSLNDLQNYAQNCLIKDDFKL